MKNICIAAVALLVLSACGGHSKQEAIVYDNLVNGEFEAFSHVYTEYALTFNSDSLQYQEDMRAYACNEALQRIAMAKRILPFDKDTSYAHAFRSYLNTMLLTMQEHDGPRIRLQMKDSLMTKDDSAKVEELRALTVVKTNDAYMQFISAQKKFREKYSIGENPE